MTASAFLFLMIRRPRNPTLFPYPTLSRSAAADEVVLVELDGRLHAAHEARANARAGLPHHPPAAHGRDARNRSEEHTSELQSRQYLVCRLLLEKQKYLGGQNVLLHILDPR